MISPLLLFFPFHLVSNTNVHDTYLLLLFYFFYFSLVYMLSYSRGELWVGCMYLFQLLQNSSSSLPNQLLSNANENHPEQNKMSFVGVEYDRIGVV